MSKQKDIVRKFTRNEQPESTRRLFWQWLAAPTDADAKNEALEELWNGSSPYSSGVEQALAATRRRIFGPYSNLARLRRATCLAIAAAVMLPLLTVALSALYIDSTRPVEADWQQLVVPYGERSELTLPDGTRLWVGAGTRVIYPTAFSGARRKIFVDGEVYAEVAHDKKHPFVISAGDTDVNVLGTTFELKAYKEDDELELTLVEGSVRLDINGANYCGEQLMKPNETVCYNRQSGSVERSVTPAGDFRSWAHDGTVRFLNESLEEIAVQLSRRFDRRIVIADPKLRSLRFDVFLAQDKSLDDVMDIFEMNRSIRVQRVDDTYYIAKR